MDAEIDIGQLPIPDWGLGCPQCRYPLRGLPSHRCPECGTELDMQSVVTSWTRLRPPRFTGDELPSPEFGLSCAACGQALAGATSPACPHCAAPFDLRALRPRRDWFILDKVACGEVPVAGMLAVLAAELVPQFPVEERTSGEIFGGHSGLFNRLRVASEFYFEVRWLLERARQEMAQARAAGGADDWTCPGCGEQNPGNFEICWNCGKVKS